MQDFSKPLGCTKYRYVCHAAGLFLAASGFSGSGRKVKNFFAVTLPCRYIYVPKIILPGAISLFRRMAGSNNGMYCCFSGCGCVAGMIIDFIGSDTSAAMAALTMITTANGSAQADPWFLKGGDDSRPADKPAP
ncbi:MAG: hypothetical protein K9K81_11570 [Desulfobacteraceae bacterium]|nr:hypothetical protein [Desulfobacteraceae bacterium]